MLRIDLLGPFQATLAKRPFMNFGTIRGQALLIYLTVEGERAHQREKLMALLWPDMPLKSAQQNLRQTLYLLRKQVPDVGNRETLFLTTRQTIQLNPAYPISVDVRNFNELIKAGTVAGRQQAADLYRGDFLADFFLADSELYEAWAADRRAEYGRLALDAFDTLAAHYLEISDFAKMEKIARRTLLVDDLHEPAHQQLMKALAGRGRQQSAVAHYETFRQQLVEELAVEPNAQTQQLAAQIRQGQAAVERTSAGEPTREPSTAVEDDRLDLSRRTNLLAPTKPLIGRDAELNELDQFFTARGVRLVTIVGPGGMGKTRLSIAWALRQADSQPDLQILYPDGRYFVDLAPITSSEQVGPALADALPFPLRGERRSPEEQILDYLREKKLLLLIDNFEHVLDAAGLINDILQSAPDIHIMVTSRQRLHLSSEQVYALTGLSYPETPGVAAEEKPLESFGAVQLLLQSVRRVRPGFELLPKDQEHVIRICRHSAGMPLAIELAASWIDVMSLGDVADGIEQSLDLLETELRDLPERHRSIRAAIDTSWNYLLPAERQIFARLTSFQGGFSWEAAHAVVGEGLNLPAFRRVVSRLVNKSLLQYDASVERFTIHELLRQYGYEKLLGTAVSTQRSDELIAPGEELAIAQEKHALHFAGLLKSSEPGLKGTRFTESLGLIEADLENILTAWRWLVETERLPELAAAMDSLAIFLETRGHFPTGRRIFEILVDHLHERLAEGEAVGQEEGKKVRLSAKAMAWQSTFEHNPDTAENLLKRSLALLVPDLHGDTSLSKEEGIAERAFTHYRLGRFLQESQLERSIHHFEKGLVLYRELGDEWGIGHCLQGLGNAYIFISFKTSQRYFDEAIQVFEKSGEKRGLAQALGWLVVSTSLQDDVGKVEGMNRRYQALITSLGDAVMPESTLEMNAVTSEALGQHAQAVAYREQYMSLLRELGRDITIRQIYLGIEYLHNDQFEKGREQLEHSLAQFQEDRAKNHDRMGFCLHVLAMLALAEDEYEQAENLFQQAREIYEHTNNQLDMAGALILTGRTKIGKGELDTAQPYLLAGLQMAYDYNGFIPLIEAFLGVALYLVHQGSYIQARAYYELAWRYPRFNQSALYDAVYAREIRMLTDTIEADTLQSIQQRSLELDPWQEAAALLEELIGLDW